jgi:hypothetical protein
VPDDEYHAQITNNYIATVVLWVDKSTGNDGDVVVTVSAVCNSGTTLASMTITKGSFQYSNVPQSFDLPFSLTYTPPPGPKPLGALYAAPWNPPPSNCSSGVNVEVYWGGKVTTNLDKVIIQDDAGKHLFAGAYDTTITSDASLFAYQSSHLKRAYLSDEPEISQFESFKTVQDKLVAGGGGPGISANYRNFDRFLVAG